MCPSFCTARSRFNAAMVPTRPRDTGKAHRATHGMTSPTRLTSFGGVDRKPGWPRAFRPERTR
eukprot:3137438-Prorocentrum_lima.AAC.1